MFWRKWRAKQRVLNAKRGCRNCASISVCVYRRTIKGASWDISGMCGQDSTSNLMVAFDRFVSKDCTKFKRRNYEGKNKD